MKEKGDACYRRTKTSKHRYLIIGVSYIANYTKGDKGGMNKPKEGVYRSRVYISGVSFARGAESLLHGKVGEVNGRDNQKVGIPT
jgi:hypothetical protein